LTGTGLEDVVTEVLREARRESRTEGVSLTVDRVTFSWEGGRSPDGAARLKLRTDAESVERAVEFLRAPVSARNIRMIEPEDTSAIE